MPEPTSLLIDILIENLRDLIKLTTKLADLTKDSKLNFKNKNYKKWIDFLENNFNDNEKKYYNRNELLIEYINDNKPHYKSLIKRVKSLGINNKLPELEEIENKIQELSNNDETPAKKAVYDIEAVPKQLAAEGGRPKDEIGGAIYDLRLLHGFGMKTASNAVNKGVRLEKLLSEWEDYKQLYGDVLMLSKLPIPAKFAESEFKKLPIEKQHHHKSIVLKNNLKSFENLSSLNHEQLIGVKYFHHISEKIPRQEVENSEKLLKKIAAVLNKEIYICCCGSYRRGRDRSGDIDALMYHPSLKTKEEVDSYFSYKDHILKTLLIC